MAAAASISASTLAYAGIAASAAGTGLAAYGAAQSASAQSAAANYQAAVAANNALIAKQQAQATTQAGDITASNTLMAAGQRTASIRAAAAASGVDADTGTPVSLQSDSAKLGMLDALTVRNNAARQAYSQQAAAVGDTAQSQLYSAEATQAQTAGQIGAFGSLLSGASTVSSRWQQYMFQSGANGGNTPNTNWVGP